MEAQDRVVHFRKFLFGSGSVCEDGPGEQEVTLAPECVTCPKCLGWLGLTPTRTAARDPARIAKTTP